MNIAEKWEFNMRLNHIYIKKLNQENLSWQKVLFKISYESLVFLHKTIAYESVNYLLLVW